MSCKETSSPIIYGMPPQYAFFREENPNFPPYSLSFNIFTSSPMSWKKSSDSFLQYIHPWLHIFRLPEHLCHATQQPWVPSDLIEEKNVYLHHFPCPAPLMCICLASPCLLPRRITNIADSTNHHLRGKKPKNKPCFDLRRVGSCTYHHGSGSDWLLIIVKRSTTTSVGWALPSFFAVMLSSFLPPDFWRKIETESLLLKPKRVTEMLNNIPYTYVQWNLTQGTYPLAWKDGSHRHTNSTQIMTRIPYQ